jgi:hypothetical protein
MTNHFMVKQASTLNVRMSHYSLDVYSTREYQRQSNLAYAWDVALDPVYLGILAESTGEVGGGRGPVVGPFPSAPSRTVRAPFRCIRLSG